MRRTINVVDICNTDLIGPSWNDHSFILEFMGDTPSGKELKVRLKFGAWAIQYIGQALHKAVKEQERFVANNRAGLERGE